MRQVIECTIQLTHGDGFRIEHISVYRFEGCTGGIGFSLHEGHGDLQGFVAFGLARSSWADQHQTYGEEEHRVNIQRGRRRSLFLELGFTYRVERSLFRTAEYISARSPAHL